MAHSRFMKHLPIMIKVFTSLDVNKEEFNNRLLLLKFGSNLFLFFSTLSCLSGNEGNLQDVFNKYHDLLVVSFVLSAEISLVKYKSQVCTLIKFLVEPLNEFEPNTVPSEIVKYYNREVALYDKIASAFVVLCVPFYVAAPSLLFVFDSANTGTNECTDLGNGWVSISDSYWYILPVYFGSAIVCVIDVADILLGYLVMAYVILKIKCTIRLLCADLDDMNRLIDWSEECSEPSSTGGNSMYWEEESVIRTAPRENDSRENKAERPKSVEIEKDAENLGLQTYRRENILRDRMKLYVADIVKRHVHIIQYVKLVDNTFRLQVLVYFQLGGMIMAFAVPKLSLGDELINIDYISRGLEVFGSLALMGVISFLGQTLLDESESLRQALYSCDWTYKPLSLRRDLLIMQTVATRPLRLTVGGIYTLGMETYGNIVRAAYSYTSLIQTVK